MRMLVRILIALVSIVVLLIAAGWLGLQVKAASFPAVPPGAAPNRVPLPDDLPEPVLRYARTLFGETIPEVHSAQVFGRGRLINKGLALPTRMRLYYDAARMSHYHDFQVTWFTLPVLRVSERNLDGHAILDLPGERVENDPFTDAAANQGYWSETLAWVPAIVFNDPRVRWEAIDAHTARMYLPNADDVEAFTVGFDPDTGLLSTITTLRYGNVEQGRRERWSNRVLAWAQVGDLQLPALSETWWNDDAPWATWEVEQVVYNVDVSARLAQFGGDVG